MSELVTSLGIIVLLVSLAIGARKFAEKRFVWNACILPHSRMLATLERYKTELKRYPAPAHPDETVTIDGRTFQVGDAMMLYQIMSGDGTDQIDTFSAKGQPSNGKMDEGEPFTTGLGLEWFPWKEVDGRRFAVDAYGHPFQYQLGGSPDALNATYDLWSYGDDLESLGKRDAATKSDPAKTARWIKNFLLDPIATEEASSQQPILRR